MQNSSYMELIKLRGVIKKITTETDDSGKTVFFIDTATPNVKREHDNTVRCRAFRTGLIDEMPVEIEGYYDGNGINCTRCEFTWISEKSTVDYYMALTKSKQTGIGQRKIEAMVRHYGSGITHMDRNTLQASLIHTFDKWSVTAIYKFMDAIFNNTTSLIELEQFLSPYDINYETILNIYEEYKDNSVTYIKKNPYPICLQFGIRIRIADAIAYKLGIQSLSYKRLNGLIEYYLDQRSSKGHTYTHAPKLAQFIDRFSERSVFKTRVPAICVADAVISNPKVRLDAQNKTVALKYLYNAEINIATRLKRLSLVASNIKIDANKIAEIEKKYRMQYGNDQKNAFYLLEDGGISILTGGPGTGKTSVIRGIVEYYKLENPKAIIRFVAPTGRAAKRLTESSGYKASTIHKLVNYSPYETGNTVEYNSTNPLNADLIIVDEVSMVDVPMMEMLLLAVKDTCRVLFVGDEHQLPSVGPGNCLHDMIASGVFPVYRLTENFRQNGTGTIVDNADRILAGNLPVANDTDFRIIKCQDDTDGFETLKSVIKEYYDINDPFKTQIIEPSKKGVAGTYKVNEFVHRDLVFKDEMVSSDIQPGDKVMFLRNQYVVSEDNAEPQPLYVNGEICIVDYMDDKEIVVIDDAGEETKVVPHSAIRDMVLAYSFTIHKSQGSENPIIIIYLPESTSNMMYRSLLYTAVTRAKKVVAIIYTGDALQMCIDNTTDTVRYTRLADELIKAA